MLCEAESDGFSLDFCFLMVLVGESGFWLVLSV